MKGDQKCKKDDFWGIFLAWPPFCRKSETTFSRQHPPKMVEQVFVLFIYNFWTRNWQILVFEHFELVLGRFYSVKRTFSTKWWPGEENAPKIIFFCIFGLLLYKYKIYQVGQEFRKVFDILVHPNTHSTSHHPPPLEMHLTNTNFHQSSKINSFVFLSLGPIPVSLSAIHSLFH